MSRDWRVRAWASGDLAAAHALLAQQGWGHRLGDVAELQALVAASQRVFIAEAGGSVVGFVRAITDGLSNGYLSMLVVAPSWRGRGIGRALVDAALGDDPRIGWVLRVGREGAAGFFARLGFEPATMAMERRRRTSR